MRAALASLLLALPLFAQTYRFDPPAPTDRTVPVLQVRDTWHDGCSPADAVVTREGNAIHVLWSVPRNVACPQAILPWKDDVGLGLLPAGTYTVTMQIDDQGTLKTIGTLPLVVKQAAPAMRSDPAVADANGGTQIRFPDLCEPGTVIVDGVTIPSRIERCHLTAELPPHAPGPVNVRVITASRTYDLVNAVHYIDPAAAPDPAVFERVLLPVLFQGDGAFGSKWRTEIVMRNYHYAPLESILELSEPLRPLGGGAAMSVSQPYGHRPNGLVLFLPRGNNVTFTNHVRDISRDAEQWGTQIPVVRERDTRETTLVFGNVPIDPRYRMHLRIYGIDGVTVPVTVSYGPAFQQAVEVRGPCTAMPCNSDQPAFALVDVSQGIRTDPVPRTILVEQRSLKPQRLWAFITLTNNETQRVTVISPQ